MTINEHPLFAGIEPEVIAEIVEHVACGPVRTYRKNEVVIHESTKGVKMALILNGRVSVFEAGVGNDRHLSHVVEEGGIYGETLVARALVCYPGMAIAATVTELIFFDIERVRSLWQKPRYAKMFENLCGIVSAHVREHWRKLSLMNCKTAEGRFMLFLRWRVHAEGRPDVTLPFPNQESMAQYPGISRTALSLAVTRLVKRGEVIHPGGPHFILPMAK